jgi:dTDP-4-amino-4,6-dideoxygalactose transaminase
MNQRRRDIIEQYSNALKDSGLRMVTSIQKGEVAHLAVLEVPDTTTRDNFREYMKKFGIQTDIHYPILDCDQKGFRSSKSQLQLPRSRRASDLIVTIPLFPELTHNEIAKIVTTLADFK